MDNECVKEPLGYERMIQSSGDECCMVGPRRREMRELSGKDEDLV